MASISLFNYCPMCGSNQLKPRGANLLVCGQCDYYQHLNPVAAVAALLADATGRLLFIRRAHEPSKGKLGAPGGFAVTPADTRYVWGGYYEPGSLIWRSRWVARGMLALWWRS